MQLKNHLNFLGDRNKQEITFHLSGAINKNVVVGVDDFDEVWSYLVLLSKQHTEADILQWKENYHVTDAELCGIHSFISGYTRDGLPFRQFCKKYSSGQLYGQLGFFYNLRRFELNHEFKACCDPWCRDGWQFPD